MAFSFETLIMVGAITFCIGGLIGSIISRTFLPPTAQKNLEQNLQQSRDELEKYQQDVAKHFAETSKLVSNLTQNYKMVHDHLAKGAIQLTSPEISKEILEAGNSVNTEALDASGEALDFTPPKDWAPKVPGQAGTLSEEFGFHETPEEEGIEGAPAGDTKNNKQVI